MIVLLEIVVMDMPERDLHLAVALDGPDGSRRGGSSGRGTCPGGPIPRNGNYVVVATM